MKQKQRELTAKYKNIRTQPDAIYLSRTLEILFNKFTKKGKKALARRHLTAGLKLFRINIRYPNLYNVLLRAICSLRVPFKLARRREARKYVEIPTPLRRNRGESAILQALYQSVTKRPSRQLWSRFDIELEALTFLRHDSTTHRQRNLLLAKFYEERVNAEKRWK